MTKESMGSVTQEAEEKNLWRRKTLNAHNILIVQCFVFFICIAVMLLCEPNFLFEHKIPFQITYENGTSRVAITIDRTALNLSDTELKNSAGEVDLANYKPALDVVQSDEVLGKVAEAVGSGKVPFEEPIDKKTLRESITWTRSEDTTPITRSTYLTVKDENGEDLKDEKGKVVYARDENNKRISVEVTEHFHLTLFVDVSYSTDPEINSAIASEMAMQYYQAIANLYDDYLDKTRLAGDQNAEKRAEEVAKFTDLYDEKVSEPEVISEPERITPNTMLILLLTFVIAEIIGLRIATEKGDMKTKLSYIIMGYGQFARGQIMRGLLFLFFELVFIGYMVFFGSYWISMLPSLGKQGPIKTMGIDPTTGLKTEVTYYYDNSFRILLYGVLTIFFIIAFIYTLMVNVRMSRKAEEIERSGKKLKSGKDDLRSMVDDQFHKTLLALPLTGILIFTVLPIVFMILVAFTNYDGSHNGYTNNLFHWVGLDNFNTMLSWSSTSGGSTQSYAATFGEVLVWTLIWAFFATFTNYFLGMFIAMMINKKGIKFKKGWRTVLVLTIAIPQFISLLYVSKMFAKNGIINGTLMDLGLIKEALPFWEDAWWSRFTVIFINIWIGIPYLMLITTGILMNIPADLYESARIDGANAWQQYSKITLPYMLFVTGPYLLTSFTGNMNNFNVIYLLTGGAPTNTAASGAAGSVGYSDLLITWLFKITTGAETKYYMASVVGILVFIVVAVISLVVYNLLPSIKNEEDFQ